ncbi:MAG: hypothetical protein IH932_01325 [Thaumarchaeota archaeon]|nr:hypothetical protein [Nitrososphaerota archaeon]
MSKDSPWMRGWKESSKPGATGKSIQEAQEPRWPGYKLEEHFQKKGTIKIKGEKNVS